jgi:endonuclease/exonuclease/phosphatase family metal-dependent hydrolase
MIANTHGNNIKMFGYDYAEGEGKKLSANIEQAYIKSLLKPLVFTGDFNCDDVERVFPNMVNKFGLTMALPDESTGPDARHTDYILCSTGVDILESHIVKTDTDHYLCWAKIRLPLES